MYWVKIVYENETYEDCMLGNRDEAKEYVDKKYDLLYSKYKDKDLVLDNYSFCFNGKGIITLKDYRNISLSAYKIETQEDFLDW